MMNYQEYVRDLEAKRRKERVLARSKSKKATTASEFIENTAKIAKNVNLDEKTRKKALKATNDAELARRNRFFGPPPPPDPNAAFRRKKKVKAYEVSFYIPARHQKTYNNMINAGASRGAAVAAVKELIEEEKVIEVDVEAKPTPGKYWDNNKQEWREMGSLSDGNTPWPEDQTDEDDLPDWSIKGED